MTQARQKKNWPGALQIITCFLVISAAVRVTSNIGPAFANESTAASVETPTQGSTELTEPPQTGTLLAALLEREKRVAEREDQLKQQSSALRAAGVEIDQKLSALAEMESRLRATIEMADTAAETDLTQLTTVYENMKPKEAAAVFAEMPPQFAAGFLGVMRADAAASIMTELDPEIAYSFSVVLAGRNADIPTE